MNYKQVIKYYGTAKLAGDALKITRQAVHLWKSKPIPYSRQLHIEYVTDGKLKARAYK